MMRSPVLRGITSAALVALFLVAVPAGAQIEERPGALALVQAKFYGYATPVIVVAPDDEVTFTNIDLEKHDVVQDVAADGFGAKKPQPWCKKPKKGHAHVHEECPLFWSKLIGLGDTTPIKGLQNLESGQIYSFYCTLHHGMKGKLVVR